jgi:hypothetical protein
VNENDQPKQQVKPGSGHRFVLGDAYFVGKQAAL